MGDLTSNDPSVRRHRAARTGRRADVVPTEATVDDLVAALRGEAQPPDSAADGSDGGSSSPDAQLPVPDSSDVRLVSDLPMDPDDDLNAVEDGEVSPELVSIVESLLFAATGPLRVKDLRKVLQEPSTGQVQLALKAIERHTRERGFILQQVAGGFRFATRPDNAAWVQRMLASKPTRLSRSQLEALAVIAYRQPITKAEIDHVRGVDCGAVLRVLLERDLVQIVGRKEEPGRPHLYGTTVAFLEFFNLRGLRDLPALHEFRELTEESQETLRERMADSDEKEIMGQARLAFSGESAPSLDAESGAAGETGDGDGAATEDGDAEDADESEVADDESEVADDESENADDEDADEAVAEADESGDDADDNDGEAVDDGDDSDRDPLS